MAPVAARDEIIAFLDDLLDASAFEDYGPNGLQVAGAEEVSLVVTGVSAHLELFERAAAAGAQLVLCHHGLLWRKQPLPIDSHRRARLKALFDAIQANNQNTGANFIEHGDEQYVVRGLGLEFSATDGELWRTRRLASRPSMPGMARSMMSTSGCSSATSRTASSPFEREPLAFEYGPDSVRSVGIVSGGGAGALQEAIERGLDAIVTGEPSEPAMAEAREAGITFVAGGHYATETFGVRRVGELLAERFGLDHRFEAVPNPV